MLNPQSFISDNSGLLLSFGVDITIFEQEDPSDKIKEDLKSDFHLPFQLPIEYLSKEKLHELSPIVCQDLELIKSTNMSENVSKNVSKNVSENVSETNTMYEVMFKPSHSFARTMVKEWVNHYTTDIAYLNETKDVLAEMPKYIENTKSLKTEEYEEYEEDSDTDDWN